MLSGAVQYLAEKTGAGMSNLLDMLSNLWTAFKVGFANVGRYLSDIINNVADGFKNIGGWFSSFGKDIGIFFKEVFNAFATVISYVNPFSDKFLLKIAFVPRDGFIKGEIKEVKTVFDQKFAVFDQLGDTIKAVWRVYDRADWQGIKVTIPLTNQTVTIVDPAPVNSVSKKIKFWMGGFLIIVTVMYVYRKLTNEVIR